MARFNIEVRRAFRIQQVRHRRCVVHQSDEYLRRRVHEKVTNVPVEERSCSSSSVVEKRSKLGPTGLVNGVQDRAEHISFAHQNRWNAPRGLDSQVECLKSAQDDLVEVAGDKRVRRG